MLRDFKILSPSVKSYLWGLFLLGQVTLPAHSVWSSDQQYYITRELVKTGGPQHPPRAHQIRICIFTSSPGDVSAYEFQKHRALLHLRACSCHLVQSKNQSFQKPIRPVWFAPTPSPLSYHPLQHSLCFLHSSKSGLLAVPGTCWVHSCPRAFALAVLSVILSPRYPNNCSLIIFISSVI